MKIILPPHDKISVPVKNFAEIKEEAQEMLELIRANDFKEGLYKEAYAMAHSQVSHEPKTFFVVNGTDPWTKKNFRYDIIINPVIIEKGKVEATSKEGCLSKPYRGTQKVRRYQDIKVSYLVPGWFRLKKKVESVSGLKAFVFAHEIDHFNGRY